MVALYVTSSERGSGKTTICAGLGKHLLENGKKIGFFKPIIADSKSTAKEVTDSDAAFIKNLFTLEEPVELLCPVFDDESKLKKSIQRWAGPDVEVLIVDTSRMEVAVEHR